MTASPPEFKRMLVRLPRSIQDYAAVQATAQLADLLGAQVVATFVQDAELIDMAGLSCVREFRPLGGGWHPLEGPQLVRQLEQAAATAQRLFHEAVRASRIEASFHVGVGPEVAGVLEVAADDIIVVIEPRNPAERVTQQFTRLIESAFRAPGPVMLVPSRIARTAGPIAALVSRRDDPSLRSALAIAAATRERVIALVPPGGDLAEAIGQLAAAAGVALEARPTVADELDVDALLMQLARLNERLLVMSREGAIGERAPTIALRRGVPVLLARASRDNPAES